MTFSGMIAKISISQKCCVNAHDFGNFIRIFVDGQKLKYVFKLINKTFFP